MESFLDGGVCGSRGELKLTFRVILQVKLICFECFMFSSWPWSNAINIQDSSLRQLHLEAEGFTTLQKVYVT
jgi:hypothetical protein